MSGACTPCTTKTAPCWATGNNCAALFTAVLAHLAAPAPGVHNLGMLISWSHGECSPGDARCNPFAGNNPLATTWESATAGGCWSCNANGCFVRCYATEADGAAAIADTLLNGAYPAIVAALRADWDLCMWQCSSAIRAELGVWGTGTAWLGACPGSCGGCGTCPACTACVGATCVDQCPAGDTCVNGVCTPPVSPPPSSSAGLFAALVLFGGLGAMAVIEARRHPGVLERRYAMLSGDGSGLGGTTPAVSRASRIPRKIPSKPAPAIAAGGFGRRRV